MYETSKAFRRRARDPMFASRYFVGAGIDIGSGPDPLTRQLGMWPGMRSCEEWDQEDGDAQLMEGVPDDRYDFVYSSHCLEHVENPAEALDNWWRILKPGGHLILVVPDEDLYEQGVWPPTFNTDHKHTFTIYKLPGSSWSPVSRNLGPHLGEYGEMIKLERVIEGFVEGLERIDQTSVGYAESCIECIVRKPPLPAPKLYPCKVCGLRTAAEPNGSCDGCLG